MKRKNRKALLVLIAMMMVFGVQAIPFNSNFGIENQVYGSTLNVSSKLVDDVSAVQGDENVVVTVKLENKDSGDLIFDNATLGFSSSNGITVTGGTTGEVKLMSGQTAYLTFALEVKKGAETGSRTMSLVLKKGGSTVHDNGSLGNITISENLATPSSGSGNNVASLDITHSINPTGGFSSGQDNKLTLKLFNNGSTLIKNAVINLTMPDGLSLNNASNSAAFGYISMGARKEISFPITVDDDTTTKSYAIIAEVTGLDYSNDAVSIKRTFYIPVNGSGGSIKDADITNINIPNEVAGQDEFNLSFDVQNQSKADLKNMKVSVEVPEGLLNKTRTTFIEASIPAGSSKNYSVTMFAADGAKEKAYPIKISLASSTAKDDAASVIEYANVYISGVTGEKTPQLMVDNYSYGGTFVQAGDTFILDLGLYNTSSTHTMTNIKVTVSSEEGTFIPVNSSNSFFIDKLEKKKRTEQSLCMVVKPAAEQKTSALTVDMSYEDGSGNPFTSKDIISIPVMQETRLDVDDVIAPPELYAGMQTGLSVQFYNMGKTILNNLRVTAEGDFDTPESTSYFVGNMEGGKSDTYDFSFIPRKAGPMEGKIIFTYEDASGNQQVLERPFTFEVMEAMPVDEGMPPEEAGAGGSKGKLPWIIGGAIVCAAGIGVFVWRKIRNKKINREMEIDE